MVKVDKRLHGAYRPRTVAAYTRQFIVFISFASYMQQSQLHSLDLLLAFVECLSYNGLSLATVKNYVSAVKQQFQLYSLPLQQFAHPKLHLMYKSLSIHRPLNIKVKGVIDIPMLRSIMQQCEGMSNAIVYKALFLTAFYSFLRISNFVSETVNSFDYSRQLIRNDIIWGPPGAHIIVKWSKTLQCRDRAQVVQIPSITDESLCPVKALQCLFHINPLPKRAPLICNANGRPLTQYDVRQVLAKISTNLKLPPGHLTFHAFRRSGATLAFNQNVSLQNIQSHGGWRSSAIWHYLNHTSQAAGVVAHTFQSIIQ